MLQGLLFRDELGRLDAVHQQLQLWELKLPLADEIPGGGPYPHGLHVQSEQPQGLHVVIDALALGGDVLPGQIVYHLGHRHRVLLV